MLSVRASKNDLEHIIQVNQVEIHKNLTGKNRKCTTTI